MTDGVRMMPCLDDIVVRSTPLYKGEMIASDLICPFYDHLMSGEEITIDTFTSLVGYVSWEIIFSKFCTCQL